MAELVTLHGTVLRPSIAIPTDRFFNPPRVPVCAGVAPLASGPDLPMVRERGERYLPSLAGLLAMTA